MIITPTKDLYPAEPARGWIPWGVLAPFLALAFVIATALAGDWLISGFVNISPEGSPLDPAALVAFTLVPFGLLLLMLLVWVRFVERRSLESLGVRGDRKVREFLGGHAAGLAGLLGVVMVIWMVGGLQLTSVAPAFSQPASLVPIVLLLFTFALQASVEELLFRGWLMSVLARKFSVPVAVIVSSALVLDFQASGPDWLTGGAQGPEASVVCFGYFVIGIAFLWRQSRRPVVAAHPDRSGETG